MPCAQLGHGDNEQRGATGVAARTGGIVLARECATQRVQRLRASRGGAGTENVRHHLDPIAGGPPSRRSSGVGARAQGRPQLVGLRLLFDFQPPDGGGKEQQAQPFETKGNLMPSATGTLHCAEAPICPAMVSGRLTSRLNAQACLQEVTGGG